MGNNFYIHRTGKDNKNFKISFNKVKEFFIETYLYYDNSNIFNEMFYGKWEEKRGERNLICPPILCPSANVYFTIKLNDDKVFPIDDNYSRYSKEILFSVIEILYLNMGKYEKVEDFSYNTEEKYYYNTEIREEFRETINSFLRFYEDGFYLSNNGLLLELPNEPILEIINKDVSDILSDEILKKFEAAIKMFLHFSTLVEEKRKAIAILADILEPLREEVKNILNDELDINKKDSDSLIFSIVNKFQIRHNDEKQNKEYNNDIWFEWMFHYYSATIIAYYSFKKNN